MHACMHAYTHPYALLFAQLVGTVSKVVEIKKKNEEEATLLAATLDETTITSLDTSGDGMLDESEFVLGMLLTLGKVRREDAQVWKDRFRELDMDTHAYVCACMYRCAVKTLRSGRTASASWTWTHTHMYAHACTGAP